MDDEIAFELDREFEHTLYSPVCIFCQHLVKRDLEAGVWLCAAFPEGIPWRIWDGRNKHLRPYPGDHGIRFEALPEVRPEVLEKYGLVRRRAKRRSGDAHHRRPER
jgi:hypothetical protein